MKRKADRSRSPKSSADPARPPGRSLQLAEDMAFQQRNWRAERIAWMAMALTVLAALLGLFGSGPLSEARSADPSGALEVSYSRFLRLSAPASITVKARPAPAPAEGFALLLDAPFTQAFRIASVTPPPVRSLAAGEGLRMEFASSGADPAAVTLHLEPVRFGSLTTRMALSGGPGVPLRIFIYP